MWGENIQAWTAQEEVFKRREEGLKKKDLELQESLIRFSKFLQENDAKRMHALKKAQDERKSREEKEREIEQLVRHHTQQLTEACIAVLLAVSAWVVLASCILELAVSLVAATVF